MRDGGEMCCVGSRVRRVRSRAQQGRRRLDLVRVAEPAALLWRLGAPGAGARGEGQAPYACGMEKCRGRNPASF